MPVFAGRKNVMLWFDWARDLGAFSEPSECSKGITVQRDLSATCCSLAATQIHDLAKQVHVGPPKIPQFDFAASRTRRQDGSALRYEPFWAASRHAEKMQFLIGGQRSPDFSFVLGKGTRVIGEHRKQLRFFQDAPKDTSFHVDGPSRHHLHSGLLVRRDIGGFDSPQGLRAKVTL
jgi:hypothetical protein